MAGRKASTHIRTGDFGLSVGKPKIKHIAKWQYVTLQDVATLATGHTPSRKMDNYWGGNIPWMAIGDAGRHDGGVIIDNKEHITQEGQNNSAAKLLPEGTVCLSRSAASIGYAVILGNKMATNQGFVNWICSNLLEPRFLQSLFLAERRFLYSIAEGSAHKTIYFPEVKAFNIALPPLAEQQRIVAKLDSLFSHLDNVKIHLSNIPQLIKKFRQTILTQAVTGKLTEKWRIGNEMETGKKRLSQLKDIKPIKGKNKWIESDKLKQPEHLQSWFKCYLFDVLDLLTDGSHHSPKLTESGFPYITVRSISWNNTIDIENSKRISNDDYQELVRNGCKPLKGDVLFSKDGTVGKVFLLKKEIDMVVLSSLAILRPTKSFCSSEYLSLLMRSPLILDQALGKKTGTAIRRIVLKHLKEVEVYIPSLEEQTEIVRRIDNLFENVDVIEAKYKTLKAQIDSLPQAILTKAFKGELVEQLPTDGSAKDLLEEIKKLKEIEKKKPKSIKAKSKAKKKKEVINTNPDFPLHSILIEFEEGLSKDQLYAKSNLPQHKFLIQLNEEISSSYIEQINKDGIIYYIKSK